MQKSKILFFITKGNFGGAQRYVFDLATHLPKDQFEVSVACGQGETLKQKLTGKNIRVIELPSSQRDISIFKDIKTFLDIIKIIKNEKPNIVHLNSSKIGLLGSLAILYIRISYLVLRNSFPTPRSIFTSHGWAFNEERNLLSKFIILVLHWFTVLLSDKTITVSEKTKKGLDGFPFIKEKMTTIHNGIENFETLPREEARKKLSVENRGKTIILSIGELHKNKGIDVALKGLSLISQEIQKNIIYTIVGAGEEENNLKKLSKELGLENIVNFVGFVDNAKQIISGADIFLLPSRTENLPYVLLEAGICGLPIISTSVGGIPEIIKDMENGILVHSKNPREIAEAILYLLEHTDKQKEFGFEAKKTISNFFSLNKMIEKTLKLYTSK